MTQKDGLLPPFLELEAFRRSVNRKLWFVLLFLTVVTLGSLGLAVVALARPLAVVAFDKEGRAMLFEDTVTPRTRLERIRIEHFVKTFLEKWACLDSGNIQKNVTTAVNMMTPRFRRIVLEGGEALERRLHFEDGNITSRMVTSDMKIASFDPADLSARIYLVVRGRMRFTPKVGGDSEQALDRYYFTKAIIERTAVTKETIYGLMVDFAETKFFDSAEALEAYALKTQ